MSIPLARMLDGQKRDSVALVSPFGVITREELLATATRLREEASPDMVPILGEQELIHILAGLVAYDGWLRMLVLTPRDRSHTVAQLFNGCRHRHNSGLSTRWAIATSGTTGTPKLVSHTLASLTRTVKRETNAGSHLRWALLYDPCTFAGLQVCLQALVGGSTLLAPPLVDPDSCVDFLVEHSCTSLSATPSMWRLLLTARRVGELRPSHVTLGGEIADEKILTALSRLFPAAKLTHIYASTEAGVGFSVGDRKAGFPLSYLDHIPNGAVQIKIDEQSILRIRDNLAEQDYFDHPGVLRDDEGYVVSGDVVAVRGGRVYFLGRANGSINVGGQKVMPEEIESVVRTCDCVREARVFAKPNPVLGNVVCAQVVLAEGIDEPAAKREIVAACSSLETFKRPVIVKFVSSIVLSHAGKVQRGTI